MNKNREYKSDLFSMLMEVPEYDLFGRKQIPIPTPKFVVFYNDIESRLDREEMRLSNAFEHQEERYELNLLCVAYNINPGYNEYIQRNSKVLSGYTAFVEKVRRYANQGMILKDALKRTIDECICENILAEFFRKHRREVVEMEYSVSEIAAKLAVSEQKVREVLGKDNFYSKHK